MTIRIEVASKIVDARAVVRKKKLKDLSVGLKIENIEIVDVYTFDVDLNKKQVSLVMMALGDLISQKIGENITPKKFSWAIEVGFLPGVTDNVATSTKEIVEDILKIKFKQKEGVYTSQITFLSGELSFDDILEVASSLYNPLIQRVIIKSFKQYKKDGGMGINIPRVKLNKKFRVLKINLNIDDEELIKLGKVGIVDSGGKSRGPLALDLIYLKAIKKYFEKKSRQPTDIELETIAQTWSEHCKHTIFANKIDEINNGLFKSHIKAATEKIRKNKGKKDFCVSVFTDNSGAIDFDDKYLITHKVETHNSPSALDPFGGSITGIVGVNRDAIGFGMGAKPVANVYGFCLANPKNETELFRDSKLKQRMLSSKRIMDGVISGVNSGGNQSGIPTSSGFLYFDDDYRGKPLVFCGTVGLIPRKINGKRSDKKRAKPGDLVVMVGGRVGKDGIHGATFSSELLDSGSPATAVQIGDPITQKKMSDALIKEARDLGLYRSITDNGAGGLSSSVAEMAKESGGCLIKLDKVPLKYSGLEPWQIWISESQERMTLAIPRSKWKNFEKLMKRRGVEASVIGKFTKSGKCQATYKKKMILDLDMDFLHDGLPPRPMVSEVVKKENKKIVVPEVRDWNKDLLTKLGSDNIAGFEFLSSQYDHEVQGGSVLKPLQGRGLINGDASVFKPVLDSSKGVILSFGLCPEYSNQDTYLMVANTIDTAIRNAVVVGADLKKIAILDNFCWCDSRNPKRLGQLRQATQAGYDYAVGFGTPFISGKDSMFNDFSGFDIQGNPLKISIPPTLLISSISVIDNVEKVVSLDFKFGDDLIYVLGDTEDEFGEIVPKVDIDKNVKLYQSYHKCLELGLIVSALGVSRGGLAVALAKASIGGMLGVKINLEKLTGNFKSDYSALYSETQGRILVSINPKNKDKFEKMMKGNRISLIGQVLESNNFIISGKYKKEIINEGVDKILKAYKSTFINY